MWASKSGSSPAPLGSTVPRTIPPSTVSRRTARGYQRRRGASSRIGPGLEPRGRRASRRREPRRPDDSEAGRGVASPPRGGARAKVGPSGAGREPMLQVVTLKEIEAIFSVTDAMGIHRESLVIPLAPAAPGPGRRTPAGKLEITVDAEKPFDEWLRDLPARIEAAVRT